MMREDDESQVSPLTASEIYLRSDERSSSSSAPYHGPRHQQETSKLIVYVLITFASFMTIFIIFGSIFFLARSPKARLRSVTITNLQANSNASSFNNTNLATLNMTMTGEITIDNGKNFGRFELENHKASVIYENVSMGEGDVFGGNFGAGKTGSRNITVQVRSNEYLSNNTNFKREIESGFVSLISYGRLRGKVHVTDVIKKHKIAVLNCTMTLNLRDKAIQDLVCT
nr:PREDICTED: late embryogenesis abundant protein At1g64065 [Daucus carota subsp. sativus]